MVTATINVNIGSLFFFLLGFLTCAGLLIVLAILYVILPKAREARRFFKFYLGLRNKEKEQFKKEAKNE